MTGTGMGAAVRAEVTKLWTVRATPIALALVFATSVGIGILSGWSARMAIESDNPALRPDFTPEEAGLDGILYGQIAMIVFGVLVVTSEYGTGMIRLSLIAVPRREQFYAAKLAVAALAAALVAAPAAILGYLATQAALGPHGASITTPGVPGALGGAVLYLTLMCLLAAGIAAAARSAILPLAVLLPLVLAGSQILSVINATSELAKYLPDRAGISLLSVRVPDDVEALSAPAGLAVLVAWSLAAVLGGLLVLRSRDA